MSIYRRLGCLERIARNRAESDLVRTPRGEDPERAYLREATGEPRPAVFGRYEAVAEGYRIAIQEAKAANPGSSRVPTTPELEAANDAMLRARGELREFAREQAISSERKDGES